MDDSLWFKNAVFYEVNVRAFFDQNCDGHGDFQGLIQKLDYLKDLGVTCIWLLPIYPSPLRDDGYDISDYYNIASTFGTLADFKEFVEQVHARDMRVVTDLVLNHTSDQHPWFQAARSDPNSHYHDYYVWSDTDQKYSEARIIFLDVEKSNWTWDEQAGKYFWHRFYSSQPDLNYDNPAVQQEMINVMKFWLDLGVDGFRSDAVPYLFEREGTNCENLPVTHEYLKRVRGFINDHYSDRLLLAEANQWPQDVIPYFGSGSDEFHMGFHFPLMPRIFMALRKEERTQLVWILEETPPLTENTQWCIFLRNHDELTLEMVTEEERQWMWEQYAPVPRMRLNLGIRRRLAPLLDNNRQKLELANSMLFTMPGSPIIYYGDEIGMGDNIWLPDRNGVRTPMQWTSGPNAGFSEADPSLLYLPVIDDPVYGPQNVNVDAAKADPGSLFNGIRHMLAVRKEHPAFGWGNFQWVFGEAPNDSLAVAAYARYYQGERLLIVHNLSSSEQSVVLRPPEVIETTPVNLLDGSELPLMKHNRLPLMLKPYEYFWLKL